MAGWRAIFVVLTVLGAVCLGAIAFGLPETLPHDRRVRRLTAGSVLRAFGAVLARPRFVLAALAAGSAAGVLFAFITGSSSVFLGHFGMSKPGYSIVFTAVVLAMILGGQVNRRLLVRGKSPARVLDLVLSTNLLAAALLLPAAAWGPMPLMIILAGTIAMLGLALPNAAAAAVTAVPQHAGSSASLLGVLQFGCGFAASTLVALLQNGTPWPMLGVMAACVLLGRIVWFAHRRVAMS